MKKTVGRCIYCGTNSQSLSREHIVPLGLLPKGQEELVLEKASCSTCSDKTSAFERNVLRNLLRMARASLEMKSYREHPKSFPIKIGREKLDVLVEKLGAPIMLPIFSKPAANKIGIDVVGAQFIWYEDEKLIKLIKEHGSIQVKWKFKPVDFAKMVAKIAYGFAIYQYGIERFREVFVLPSILGEVNDVGNWVGCIDKKTDGTNYIHLESGINKGQVVVHIRFFEKWNGPTYVVLVGKIKTK